MLHGSDWIESARTTPLAPQNRVYESRCGAEPYDHQPEGILAKYRISLQGLQCSSCVHLLEKLPEYLPTVRKARVNFSTSEINLEVDRTLSLGQILQFIEEMGYPAHPLLPSESNHEALCEEDREILTRLGVAGACAGNIMLFTIPVYAGLEGPWALTFNIIAAVLFLPIIFYSATPFYKNAWAGLKMRHLSIDTPLVFTLWAGFSASLFNLVRGNGALYFDSTAGFIFLILVSRWFLRFSHRRWVSGPVSDSPWQREIIDVIASDGHREERLAKNLFKGDRFVIKAQQILAVDALLESDRAAFDTSWMTGEAFPRVCQKGMRLPAGYRCLSAEARCVALSNVNESELATGLRKIESDSLLKSEKMGRYDRAARLLLIGVASLGVLLFVGGPWIGLTLEDSFQRALSLMIVACPCALAFGGPLAYGMALRRAARNGVLLRSADVLDRVLRCTTVIFDKTGTLTTGQLVLKDQTPKDLPAWIKDLVLSLERKSNHPIADAFRAAWAERSLKRIEIQDVHEIPGEKIFGIFNGYLYCLQSASAADTGIVVALTQNHVEIARFIFDDELRVESHKVLQQLSSRYRLQILSGDRGERVETAIAALDLAGLTGVGEQKPEQKAEIVRALNPCLMVGDGFNDGQALAAAEVGVALNGAIVHGLQSGHVYFLKPGLQPLLTLLDVARKARKITRRNMSFALAYNIGAGAAALLGWINPLVAAVLMPASSLLILVSTWEVSP